MNEHSAKLGFLGIVAGAVALLIALVHFHAGPFAPEPTLEQAMAEQAETFRKTAIAVLEGREAPPPPRKGGMNVDDFLVLAVAVLGGLALVLGVLGYARKEPARVAGSAAVLGIGAIAFQIGMAAMS